MPQCQHHFFINVYINIQKSFQRHNQNLKKIQAGLKTQWSLYDEYSWSWKPFAIRVYSSNPFDVPWGVINASKQWLLGDHSSIHRRWGQLCGSAAMCLSGGIHAMKSVIFPVLMHYRYCSLALSHWYQYHYIQPLDNWYDLHYWHLTIGSLKILEQIQCPNIYALHNSYNFSFCVPHMIV